MNKQDFKNYMLHFINIPYRFGGDDPMAGYDCSGLMMELLTALGVQPPQDMTASSLYNHFRNRPESGQSNRSLGTLCFYGKPGAITHVAMCFDELTVIEAGSGTSQTTNVLTAIKQNAYIRLRPVEKRKDLLAVVCPKEIMDALTD